MKNGKRGTQMKAVAKDLKENKKERSKMNNYIRKTYSELVALRRLKEIEKKNGGLINGNFSFVAHENKIKVKRLRELYQEESTA